VKGESGGGGSQKVLRVTMGMSITRNDARTQEGIVDLLRMAKERTGRGEGGHGRYTLGTARKDREGTFNGALGGGGEKRHTNVFFEN